jgi:hypothetical protein
MTRSILSDANDLDILLEVTNWLLMNMEAEESLLLEVATWQQLVKT